MNRFPLFLVTEAEAIGFVLAHFREQRRPIVANLRDAVAIGAVIPKDVVDINDVRPDGVNGGPSTTILCRACDDDHPLLQLDNDIDDCVGCRRRVQFRQCMPPGPHLCFWCAVASIRRGEGP
jgi:hypothetical protein